MRRRGELKCFSVITELATLPEEERVSRLLMMAEAEYELHKPTLRTFTISRLSVWLMLEPEVARRISGSYDAAMRKLPGLQTTPLGGYGQNAGHDVGRRG